MNYLTQDQYNIYRERVAAKTNGANVHKVNGLLGIVLNGSSNIEWLKTQNDRIQFLKEAEQAVEDSIKEIAKLTGVHP